jgi:hypothetical protein
MKITLTQDFGSKTKGTSFEISAPVGASLITKGVAVKFGEEVKKPKKVKEDKVEEPKTEE